MVTFNENPCHVTSKAIFVSGGTGYIAQQLIKLLISLDYKVITSVRSASKGDKLVENFNSPNLSYEIIPSIEKQGAFDEALKKHRDVRTFVHTASPVSFNSNDPLNEVLLPAIDGTKFLIESTYINAPQIKKLVVTSSLAALANSEQNQDPNYVIDETCFNNATFEHSLLKDSYWGSKALSEKVVWDFKREKYPNFEVTMIMPAYTIGPQAFDSEIKSVLNATAEGINSLLKLGSKDSVPDFIDSYIDVRDIAKAHLIAIENESTNNQRLFVRNSRFSFQLVMDIIKKNFPNEFGHLPAGKPITNFYDEVFSKVAYIDDKRTRTTLNFDYIPLEKSIVDSVNQILRASSKS